MDVLFIAIVIIVEGIGLYLISRKEIHRAYKTGLADGQEAETKYWEKLKEIPIAGMRHQVPTLGEVMILGRGEVWDAVRERYIETIDYIPESALNGLLPSEIDSQILQDNTISCPLELFVAQTEISLRAL